MLNIKLAGTRVALTLALAAGWSSACLASTDTITIQGQLQVGSNYTDFGNLAGTSFTPAPATERSRSRPSMRSGH